MLVRLPFGQNGSFAGFGAGTCDDACVFEYDFVSAVVRVFPAAARFTSHSYFLTSRIARHLLRVAIARGTPESESCIALAYCCFVRSRSLA